MTDPILSAWSPNSKLTLVHSKSYGNKLYYIPFDAFRRALQGGVFGFSILNGSPYPTGSFKGLFLKTQSESPYFQFEIFFNCYHKPFSPMIRLTGISKSKKKIFRQKGYKPHGLTLYGHLTVN